MQITVNCTGLHRFLWGCVQYVSWAVASELAELKGLNKIVK